jgi:glycosyltransferase involved in cell wall biosynthesis
MQGAVDMPIGFEAAPHWRKSAKISDLLKVWMSPTPSEAGRDITNSINLIVTQLDKYLPDYGIQLVEEPDGAQVHAGHAGQGSQSPLDVAHYHGLYPTANGSDNFAVNAAVIRNLKTARIITAPSEWIADVIRRDMHVNPRVIGWGVDTEEWKPSADIQKYVIWNKARVDDVSNPQPMLDLAAMAHDVLFLTTFGEGTPNVKTIGRQPYEVMKQHVRHASVYLSTNVETFGIGTIEAMAAGVPVLAFRQGNTDQIVEHGVTGFLAEVGDMDGLYAGLQYCLEHRKRLSANAREASKKHTWQRVAQQFAAIYFEVMEMKADIRPHQIDESIYKGAVQHV